MVTEKSPNRCAANADCYVGIRILRGLYRATASRAMPDVRFRTSPPARFPRSCPVPDIELGTRRGTAQHERQVLPGRWSGSSVRDRSLWSLATERAAGCLAATEFPPDLQECL